MRIGDLVAVRALPSDGGRMVRGIVRGVLPGLVLLELPHGRWCLTEGGRVLERARRCTKDPLDKR